MKYKDMIQAVKLLEDEWDLGKKNLVLQKIYVHGYI